MAASTITNLDVGANTTSETSQVTASIAYNAYDLILLAVENRTSSGTPNVPTASGAGLTFTQVNTQYTGQIRQTVLRAMAPSGGSGTITIDYAGQTSICNSWSVTKIDHVKTTGVNGADAIVQNVMANNVGTLTGLTVTLGAFASASNSTWGNIYLDNGVAINAGSGFTKYGDASFSNNRICTEWRVDNDTTVDWTWASTSLTCYGLAIELANGEPPGGGGMFISS
jgi:hypothetical protein